MRRKRPYIICNECGKFDRTWTIPDAVWQGIVPPEKHGKILCWDCFKRYMVRKGIVKSFAVWVKSPFTLPKEAKRKLQIKGKTYVFHVRRRKK